MKLQAPQAGMVFQSTGADTYTPKRVKIEMSFGEVFRLVAKVFAAWMLCLACFVLLTWIVLAVLGVSLVALAG